MHAQIKLIPSNLPAVVLFGRTNVGKSTLFNKLTGTEHALVSERAGTTRDCNIGIVSWQGKEFQLIDAGGILNPQFLAGKHKIKELKIDKENLDDLVQLQVKKYLRRADIILFVVDCRAGLMEQDKIMARLLKRLIGADQKIILAANKADSPKQRNDIAAFFSLSLGSPIPVSASNGSGTGDLLDTITKVLDLKFPPDRCAAPVPPTRSGGRAAGGRGKILDLWPEAKNKEKNGNLQSAIKNLKSKIKVAILGRPNAGKSTLLNAIIGENRFLVSKQAHTTREPNDAAVEFKGEKIIFMDTAGIIKAKSKKTRDELIRKGIAKSKALIRHADIALLVLDINEEISHQEAQLTDEILSQGASLAIVANKWDLAREHEVKKFTAYINARLPFAVWAPIIFLSAKNKTKINNLLDLIIELMSARLKQISAGDLENFLRGAVRHAAPLSNQKARGIFKQRLPRPQLISLTQTSVRPSAFDLKIKSRSGLKDTYIKYLENRLREEFKLIGTPVRIYVKN